MKVAIVSGIVAIIVAGVSVIPSVLHQQSSVIISPPAVNPTATVEQMPAVPANQVLSGSDACSCYANETNKCYSDGTYSFSSGNWRCSKGQWNWLGCPSGMCHANETNKCYSDGTYSFSSGDWKCSKGQWSKV